MPTEKIDTLRDFTRSFMKMQMTALRQPQTAMSALLDAQAETLRALAGQSDLQPERGDKRFKDPVWNSNPAYKALMQSYLAWTNGLDSWLNDLDIPDRDKLRSQFVSRLLLDGLAPTNFVASNPAAMKATFEQGGDNLVRGLKNLARDMTENGGLPSTVDKSSFKVGETLAVTPGSVIYSEDHLELIQYKPQTDKVFERPIFIVPPQINKFYIWDLAPGRSIVEALIKAGHQVFIVSWRNPGPEYADWGLNSYVDALDRATEAACEISGSKDLNVVGACSGGITASVLLSQWAANGIKRAKSVSLLVTILDTAGAKDTTMGLFTNLETLELAKLFSKGKGVLEGKDLERAFAWLRPNDLIWSYWVSNYLLGNEAPAFDILYWNADTTNLPARLHADLLGLLQAGGLAQDGLEQDGRKIDLSAIKVDAFLVGGETDHITPWAGCYLTRNILGGDSTYVLSQSGHIQSLINPPGNPKARYLTNSGKHDTPESFLEGAEKNEGSWWPMWIEWLSARGGKEVAAKPVGSKANPAGIAAPGNYALAG